MHCHNPDSLYAIFAQVIRFHYYRTHQLLEQYEIYPGQPPLLFLLSKQDGQSQKYLAEKIYLKPATITIMLKRMEKAHLITRTSDLNDQRIIRVYLTAKGRKITAQIKEALKTIEAECFENFTGEEKIILRRLFLQMRENLSSISEVKSHSKSIPKIMPKFTTDTDKNN